MATETVTTENSTQPLQSQGKLLSPTALCHVVLRTTAANYEPMVKFYLSILGASITHKTYRLCFLSYDHEHHRIAILIDPRSFPRKEEGSQVGLHHMAFGFDKLSDLAESYEQKKAMGILPTWCVNHGMSTSMYYQDPDGNELEFQVDNYDTVEEAVDFMASPEFEENPVGVDFDAETFVGRLRSGESEAAIKARPNIGRRDKK
ncbi:Fc.00g104310.m01.CDS01 [Cosmosporella sp. VM-42]